MKIKIVLVIALLSRGVAWADEDIHKLNPKAAPDFHDTTLIDESKKPAVKMPRSKHKKSKKEKALEKHKTHKI